MEIGQPLQLKCRTARAAVEHPARPARSALPAAPPRGERDEVLTKLGKEPWEVCRMKESIATSSAPSMPRSREGIAEAEHPILIERPILVRPTSRVIGRATKRRGALRG